MGGDNYTALVLTAIFLTLSVIAFRDTGRPVRPQRNGPFHIIVDETGASTFMSGPFPAQIAQ
jgi:hypothetical protein